MKKPITVEMIFCDLCNMEMYPSHEEQPPPYQDQYLRIVEEKITTDAGIYEYNDICGQCSSQIQNFMNNSFPNKKAIRRRG